MAIFKCKMCGGDLEIQEGLTICECEYCGTKQTIPALDNEKKLNLFNRANRLRLNSEFDKAASIYENIIAEFPEEAEGYWGLVLCNYGIEYVDDPATAKKIPTCHRAAFESVTKDENYDLALEYADVISQKVYRDEAREIDRIMSEILSISKNEEPYDIFICYKETDTSGGRTIDSVIAQDVYDALTDKGYRVFFSRISLEDKIGKQYEPYIFAALNSAKVMLAFGTKYEHYHAVWVKNEWSRFLKLMAKDKSKFLVPCYKDMDAYDMPDVFKPLQAQDMGKIGAIQDLVRGVEKLIGERLDEEKGSKAIQYQNKEYKVDLDAKRREYSKVKDVISANGSHTVGLKSDGKVVAIGLNNYGQCNVSGWTDIVAIAAGANHTVGIKSDEIVAVGYNGFGQCDVQDWKEIVAISAGLRHTVGLKSDGRVVSTILKKRLLFDNGQCNVSNWRDIVAISAGQLHTVGLKSDGTVVAVGKNDDGQCDVSGWTDIVAVSAGYFHTIGVKSDGKVVAEGNNLNGQCNVSNWKDIVAVAAGKTHTVGLKSDGTVVAVGEDKRGQCNVYDWKDIVAISAGEDHTVGLKTDGTVVAVGSNVFGQCDNKSWKLWW